MSEFEKFIYNSYLKVFKTATNSPYKLRKNFSDINDEAFICVKKLASFFKRFPSIDIESFFKAPYKIYLDEKYFPLKFYTTLKATRAYTLSKKQLVMADPDSQEQLANIKNSLIFIFNFCRKANIPVTSYIDHKTNNEYTFVLHLKEHKVSVYALLGFKNFEKNLKSRDSEVIKFIIGEEFYNNVQVFRTKLFNSHKANKLVFLGLEKIIKKSA